MIRNTISRGQWIGVLAVAVAVIGAYTMFATTAQAQTVTMPLCEIPRSLTIGMEGEDVRCLQRYLNWSGYYVAQSGVGSPGNETTYFGSLTANAVARWQNANAAAVLTPLGLTSGTGYWGPSSFNHYVSLVRAHLGSR